MDVRVDIAMLSREKVDKELEHLRQMIAKEMGVTLTEDTSGAWGQCGKRYLTMRWRDDSGDLLEVTTEIMGVTSYYADQEQARLNREDK